MYVPPLEIYKKNRYVTGVIFKKNRITLNCNELATYNSVYGSLKPYLMFSDQEEAKCTR